MARSGKAAKAHRRGQPSYRSALLKSINALVDRKALEAVGSKAKVWKPWRLMVAGLVMSWVNGASLSERFAATQIVMGKLFPCTRLGQSYQGFIKALLAAEGLLDWLGEHLRAQLPTLAGRYWRSGGWCALAVDGSRVECPRTAANEGELHCAGKNKTTPQLFLTTVYHLGTGLPWSYQIGPGTDSERTHLRAMLGQLPAGCLLVADAGFVGYDLLDSIQAGGRHFLIRAGSNVTLLKGLGYGRTRHDDIVHLWPAKAAKNGRPPLTLRLIRLHDGRKPVCLITDVLEERRLSDRAAGELYRLRWGVEVFYRSFKQTLGHRKMRSGAPDQARCELAWAVLGLWMLSMLAVQRIIRSGHDPTRLSVAGAIKVVRQVMAWIHRPRQAAAILRRLSQAVVDPYVRTAAKNARNWPHKKKDKPPGCPKLRCPNRQEAQLAKDFEVAHAAA